MKYEDEDYGYEQYRQKLIDSDQWHKPTIIGSGLKDADKIQRFVHHDPRPDLNFDEDLEKPDYLMGLVSDPDRAGYARLVLDSWGVVVMSKEAEDTATRELQQLAAMTEERRYLCGIGAWNSTHNFRMKMNPCASS